jgi:cytochrome c oxidase cbb3-type subunit 3
MRGRFRGLGLGLTLGTVMALGACGQESGTEGPATGSTEGAATEASGHEAPTPPAALRTIEITPEMVSAGETIFARCQGCHGEHGEGKQGIGPHLNSDTFLAAASDEFLFNTIKHGREGTTMIAWGDSMSDDEINQVVAYVRSFSEAPAAELNEGPLAGDADAGEEIFGAICAACHGRTGAGYQETSNGTGIGRHAFLSTATNGYLRYIAKNGKSNTRMRGFANGDEVAVANLTDEQIENVIAYMRREAW